jgi:hypothetical protein
MSGFLSGRTSLTSVATENLEDGAVTTAKIADVNVTTAKIADINVTTGKVVDDAVTLAKMAPGTDGNLITYDASGNPAAVATGSSGQVLTSAGAGAPPTFAALSAGWTLVSAVDVSGGSDAAFTSLPAAIKQIVIMFNNVSLNSSVNILVTIGDSGGLETSGYLATSQGFDSGSAVVGASATASYIIKADTANSLGVQGAMTLSLQNSGTFSWASTHNLMHTTTKTMFGAGFKSLSAELTQLKVEPSGSGVFDSGSISIMYQ